MIKSIRITDQNYLNMRFDRFLKKSYPHHPTTSFIRLIRKGKLLINHQKAKFNYRLQLNDQIQFRVNLSRMVKESPVRNHNLKKIAIVYEDDNLIIVNKPIKTEVQNELNQWLIGYLTEKMLTQKQELPKTIFNPSFAHRLDTNTTGLLIAAKNYETQLWLNDAFYRRLVKKKYYALVRNQVLFKQRTIRTYLAKNSSNNTVKVVNKNHRQAQIAITTVKLVANYIDKALVEIDLKTGRTHQIRVHLDHINHPICGDRKYRGGQNNNKDHKVQALAAYYISFDEQICQGKYAYLQGKEFTFKNFAFLDFCRDKLG